MRSSDEQDKQEREVFFGSTRIERYMFAVFGPTESTTDTEDEDNQGSQLANNIVKKSKSKGKEEGATGKEVKEEKTS